MARSYWEPEDEHEIDGLRRGVSARARRKILLESGGAIKQGQVGTVGLVVPARGEVPARVGFEWRDSDGNHVIGLDPVELEMA